MNIEKKVVFLDDMSEMFNIEKKVIFLDDMSEIISYNFIKNMVGWINHGDPITVFRNDRINKFFYLDDYTNEIKEFVFDEVHCGGRHGSAGTSYEYIFYLNSKKIDIGDNKFSNMKENLIKEL